MARRKILILVVLLLLPTIIFADQGQGKMSLWTLLLSYKYLVGFFLALVGIYLLAVKKLSRNIRLIFLGVSFILFGIVFSLHPSPVCATTKPFLFGFRIPFIAMLIFMGILSLLFTKGFCGTVCPAGALQELLFNIPFLKKWKKYKIPFKVSNSVRAGIFFLSIIVALGGGVLIYEYFNLFELLHWNFDLPALDLILFLLPIIIILLASLVLFRPFCYLICPVGFLSWIIEQFSVVRIKYNKENCNNCNICVTNAPCHAVQDMMDGKKIISDCYLCGNCLTDCDKNAFTFGAGKK